MNNEKNRYRNSSSDDFPFGLRRYEKSQTGLRTDCKSSDDAKEVIRNNLGALKKTSDDVLLDKGFPYRATVRLSSEKFPYRKYDDVSFPAGVYDALIVELGEGTGNNWWCVCFPPLCFVPDDGSENFRYKSKIVEIIKKFRGEDE